MIVVKAWQPPGDTVGAVARYEITEGWTLYIFLVNKTFKRFNTYLFKNNKLALNLCYEAEHALKTRDCLTALLTMCKFDG